jgi:hypothetical protein
MRIRFPFHIILLLFVFSGCGKKRQKVIVNFDDLRPIPERQYAIDPDTIQIPAFKPKDLSSSFRPIFEQIFIENKFYPSDAEIYPTRFGPTEYLAMIQKDDYDSELASWYFLKFKDSVMTDNAWLNWLDCFGDNCQSLHFGSGDPIQFRTGQIWTNDTLIIACIVRREGTMLVKEAFKLDQFFKNKTRYTLRWEQGKSGAWRSKAIN